MHQPRMGGQGQAWDHLLVSIWKTVWNCLGLLSSRDRRLLVFATLLQMGTAFLDLVGVLLLAVVGALAVAVIQGQQPPPLIQEVIGGLGLDGWTLDGLLALFAVVSAGLLLGKSVISTLLMRRVFQFLANRQVALSSSLASALLTRSIDVVQSRSSQERAFALTQGATAATIMVLGQAVVVVSEASLLLVLGLGLLAANPYVAIGCFSYFAIVAWGLHMILGRWANNAGGVVSRTDIASIGAIQEAISVFREIFVMNRRSHYINKVASLRQQAASALAAMPFMGTLSKYTYEASLVVGGFLLALVLFSTQTVEAAVGTLTLFVAAATRIMPSLLRLQLAALAVRHAAGLAEPTLELARVLEQQQVSRGPNGTTSVSCSRETNSSTFEPAVLLNQVSFVYPGSSRNALCNVSLSINAGTSVALAGKSGAGKSTLADVILGVLEPTSGEVFVGGRPPSDAIAIWPGQVAYVPQEARATNASVRENVALGLSPDEVDDTHVWHALDMAELANFIRGLPERLDTQIGEEGCRLSGGQRQRLGIARALFTQPKLLVMDEATSALDAETELSISRMIKRLEGAVTTVVIAHRLSTIRNVDLLVYLEEGRVKGLGDFDDVRRQVRDLDLQAEISGMRRT